MHNLARTKAPRQRQNWRTIGRPARGRHSPARVEQCSAQGVSASDFASPLDYLKLWTRQGDKGNFWTEIEAFSLYNYGNIFQLQPGPDVPSEVRGNFAVLLELGPSIPSMHVCLSVCRRSTAAAAAVGNGMHSANIKAEAEEPNLSRVSIERGGERVRVV